MPGTFFGLEIGRRGLQYSRGALDITSHNLANASTEGYSRQEAVAVTTDPFTTPGIDSSVNPGQLGTGVTSSMIRRIRDEYMDPLVRKTNTYRYYWEDQINVFSRVEACFAEPASSGISDQLTEFFKGWMDLNNNPQDPGVKASVTEMGVQLASMMTYTYKQLTDVEESVLKTKANDNPPPAKVVDSGQLNDQVADINDLLVKIKDITEKIIQVYRVGQQPNDLLDRRDLYLDELAQFGPLEVVRNTVGGVPTGEISVSFFGRTVMNFSDPTDPAFTPARFYLQINDGSADPALEGHVELREAALGLVADLTAQCGNTGTGGSLLGLEKARQDILGFKDTLNAMAENLRDKIYSKNNTAPPAGVPDFFLGSLEGGDFGVNPAIISDPSALEGAKAGLIADIRNEKMDSDRQYTLEECYGMLVSDVGNKAEGVDGMAANQQAIQEQMYNLRESVSGVSVDEELTRMVQFQYGFQASSRVVTMMDQLLDEIINRLKPL
ncbi:MAG: flagellar hook-associated protein FlgK [Peptococcaceae bacterium]|nr:flagellar hook-associated protein FlgK [Peptococcaceae bacterium]